jgi:hypothetical protein
MSKSLKKDLDLEIELAKRSGGLSVREMCLE